MSTNKNEGNKDEGHKAEEVKGRLKESAGALTGDEEMKSEGKADQGKAKIKDAVDNAKDKINDAID